MSTWYKQDSDKTLASNSIHVWINYLNIHEARLKHLYPLLSAAEKERSERFKFYKHRKAFIASHGFLHTVLSYYIDIPAHEIDFSYGENGKPSILNKQNSNNIHFNLSHSNNLALLAISNNTVGIDVEHMHRKTDWSGIVKRFFTASEQEKLFNLPEEKQKEAFFQVWTRKEAHMKVTGQGLRLAPTKFEVSVPPEAADFLGYIDKENNNFYKMQDILLPEMFADYHACMSADFDFDQLVHFIHT